MAHEKRLWMAVGQQAQDMLDRVTGHDRVLEQLGRVVRPKVIINLSSRSKVVTGAQNYHVCDPSFSKQSSDDCGHGTVGKGDQEVSNGTFRKWFGQV
jgi:hypothetical protein